MHGLIKNGGSKRICMKAVSSICIATEIGLGEASFRFNLFTTERPLEEYKRKPKQIGGDSEYKSTIHGKNPLGIYSTGSRVFAGMYLGYRNGNRVSRFGIDAAWVQDLFQNGIYRK